MTEVQTKCEDLGKAIKKVQGFTVNKLGVDSSKKRGLGEVSADLDELSEEISALIRACKKIKT